MRYDPIKDRLGAFFSRAPVLQKLFYRLLDVLFLRSWYVRREIAHVLASHRDRNVQVLDAGTGFGQYVYHLTRKYPNASVVAVDIKDDYLDWARDFMQKTPYGRRVRFAVDDLTRLQAKGPFDLIVSVDVMEHIEEDEAVFQNFRRVLAPGGHVIINTPSDQGGSGVAAEGDESFIGEHVRDGYNMRELADKLGRAGLAPVRSYYTYGTPGSLAWKLSIKIPMQLLSASWLTVVLLVPYFVVVLPLSIALNALDLRTQNESGTGLVVVAAAARLTEHTD